MSTPETIPGDRRHRFDVAAEIKRRIVSRKFWIALLSLGATLLSVKGGAVSPHDGLQACVAFVTVYLVGQGYEDGQKAANIPPDAQAALISAHVDAKFNALQSKPGDDSQ